MNDLAALDSAASYDGFSRQAKPDPPNPLTLIPHDWRQPVAILWTTNAHLLPSALALCSRLRLYAEDGLTAAEVKTICRVLTEPERAARHKFAADLLADLSGLVATCNSRRKNLAETARLRGQSEAFRAAGLTGLGDLFPGVD